MESILNVLMISRDGIVITLKTLCLLTAQKSIDRFDLLDQYINGLRHQFEDFQNLLSEVQKKIQLHSDNPKFKGYAIVGEHTPQLPEAQEPPVVVESLRSSPAYAERLAKLRQLHEEGGSMTLMEETLRKEETEAQAAEWKEEEEARARERVEEEAMEWTRVREEEASARVREQEKLAAALEEEEAQAEVAPEGVVHEIEEVAPPPEGAAL